MDLHIDNPMKKLGWETVIEGDCKWDASRPDRQPRRCKIDNSSSATEYFIVRNNSLALGRTTTANERSARRIINPPSERAESLPCNAPDELKDTANQCPATN